MGSEAESMQSGLSCGDPTGGLRGPGDENAAQDGTSPPPLEALSRAPPRQDRG